MKERIMIGFASLVVFVSFIGAINLVDENAEAGTAKSGLISADETWIPAGSPFWIEGDITVANGATLTIEPGVEVRFNGFYILYVDGTLIAEGLEMNRINITSNMTSPSPGNWNTIQINSTAHSELRYCDISYGYVGVILDSSSNNNITNSNILFSDGDGLYLYSSSNNNITNNNVSFNNKKGINLYSSSNNSITSNDILLNNRDGISLESSSSNIIINNNILSNNESGIILWSFGNNNNIITDNNISLNKWIGLRITSSSSHNRIYHNKIFDNFIQATDSMNDNFWNDTYPSGGNYWSGYCPTCADNFSGSITPQTTGSPDGICDLQYEIDADSIDYYPLKNPVDITPPVITNLQPPNASTINDSIPTISANYSDISGIDMSSVVLKIDNVTVSATVTSSNVTYASPLSDGLYNISLEVKDASINQNLAKAIWAFTIDTDPPTANAGADRQVTKGEIVIFNGSASSDDSGTISNYTWTFIYDGTLITLYGVTPSYKFEMVGNYEVTLTVEDLAGNYAMDSMQVNVEPKMTFLETMWWILLIIIVAIIIFLIAFLLYKRKKLEGKKVLGEKKQKKEEPKEREELSQEDS